MREKSFNVDGWRHLAAALAAWSAAGAACCAALAVLWPRAEALAGQCLRLLSLLGAPVAAPGTAPAAVLTGPAESIRGIVDGGRGGAYAAFCCAMLVSCAALGVWSHLSWLRSLHDGAWVGGKRAAGATVHGGARLASSPRELRRLTSGWEQGGRPAERHTRGWRAGRERPPGGLRPRVRARRVGRGQVAPRRDPHLPSELPPGSLPGRQRRQGRAEGLSRALLRGGGHAPDCGRHVRRPGVVGEVRPARPRQGGVRGGGRRRGDAGAQGARPPRRPLGHVRPAVLQRQREKPVRRSRPEDHRRPRHTARAEDRHVRLRSDCAAGGEKSSLDRLADMASSLGPGHPSLPFLSGLNGEHGGGPGVVSTLMAYLSEYVDENVARMLHDDEAGLGRVGEEPTVVFVSSSSATGNYKRLVQTFVAQALSALRCTAAAHAGRCPVETVLALDEAASLGRNERMIQDLGEMRSERIHILWFCQSLLQLESVAGYTREEAETILDLLKDKVVLSCSNYETARKLSDSMGSYTAVAESRSRTRGFNNSGSISASEGLVRRPLITPDELMRWTGRETGALVIKDGAPMALPSRDVTGTFVAGMLGMTSPEAERSLMEAALEGREPRNLSAPPVWGAAPEGGRGRLAGRRRARPGRPGGVLTASRPRKRLRRRRDAGCPPALSETMFSAP